jgi:exosome complex component CSL4
MGEHKKVVLPGTHLASALEYESGENTYIEEDDIYSAGVGTLEEGDKTLAIKTSRRVVRSEVGDEVYCIVRKTNSTKAFVDCINAQSADNNKSSSNIPAVLPVTEIRRSHVRDLRDEVKTGDIIRAKICKMQKDMIDVSVFGPQYGVLIAFCSKCRARMHLKEDTFICSKCHWKERRKTPGQSDSSEGAYHRSSSRSYDRAGARPGGVHRSGRYGNRSFDQRKKQY